MTVPDTILNPAFALGGRFQRVSLATRFLPVDVAVSSRLAEDDRLTINVYRDYFAEGVHPDCGKMHHEPRLLQPAAVLSDLAAPDTPKVIVSQGSFFPLLHTFLSLHLSH